MKNWEYSELVEVVRENYVSLAQRSSDIGEVIERCFYEFESTFNEGICEKIIICSTIVMLISEESKISKRQFDKLSEAIHLFEHSNFLGELDENDMEMLCLQVEEAKKKLLKIAVFA